MEESVHLRLNRRVAVWIFVVSLCLGVVRSSAQERDSHSGSQKSDDRSTDNSKDASGAEPVYTPGGDVKPPKLVHYVEPSFSNSSKEAFVEGVVKISTVVTVDGKPVELHVTSGLNTEEDRTALDAVTQWRFEPGTKAGKAVRVKVTVEVDFHLL
jgi:TonB family protein